MAERAEAPPARPGAIVPGRWTAREEGDFVFFLIGMRVNRPWHLPRAWPAFVSMPRMLAELAHDPQSGLLGCKRVWLRGGPVLVQYWRDLDRLMAYATDKAKLHRPAWAAFNRSIGGDGSVGIWHETYAVRAGNRETIYTNMPRVGVARFGEHLTAQGARETARRRMTA